MRDVEKYISKGKKCMRRIDPTELFLAKDFKRDAKE